MNDETAEHEGKSSWLERLGQVFTSEPKSRKALLKLLREAHHNGLLDSEALSIVEGAIQVADLQVRDIMVPRSQAVVIKGAQSPCEFLPAVIESGHSRFPVTGDNADDVIGILLAKDLLPLILKGNCEDFCWDKLLRPANYVPESKRLNVLLREFRTNHNHMAVVIDEYGSMSGLITIEDVLEQIVGDIEDEHDTDEDSHVIRPLPNGDFLVKAQTSLASFNATLAASLPENRFASMGEFIQNAFGHLPRRNEVIEQDGLRFRVLSANSRRVHSLRVTPLAGGQE